MQTYIGTKIIQAEPEIWDGSAGYRVVYPDGYTSWSPERAFKDAYRQSGNMNFGHALELLKRGEKVARSGWNGKDMFLYLVPAAAYPAARNEKGTMLGVFPDDMVPYQAYIAMKTAQDTVVPWLCSQTDALAEDWCLVA
jgi:hypothetical protein